VLPWMYSILVIHGHDAAEESATHMLDTVYKVLWFKFAFSFTCLVLANSILNLQYEKFKY
jgi:hypothetical protein